MGDPRPPWIAIADSRTGRSWSSRRCCLEPANLEPADWLRFVRLDPFTGKWSKLNLTDDDLRRLDNDGAVDRRFPTGDPRHWRVAEDPLRARRDGTSRGKRGAFRVCDCLFPAHGIVLLTTLYGKNEQADLSATDRAAIARVIAAIQGVLDQGTI